MRPIEFKAFGVEDKITIDADKVIVVGVGKTEYGEKFTVIIADGAPTNIGLDAPYSKVVREVFGQAKRTRQSTEP